MFCNGKIARVNVTKDNADAIVKLLTAHMATIKHIDLMGSDLTGGDVVRAIASLRHLEILDLSSCVMKSKVASSLFEAVAKLPLKVLRISDADFGKRGLSGLADVVERMTQLEGLVLDNKGGRLVDVFCKMDPFLELSEKLAKLPNLRKLSLRNFDAELFVRLDEHLALGDTPVGVMALDLTGSILPISFAERLARMGNLVSLDLTGTGAAVAMSSAIGKLKELERLAIGNVDELGMAALAPALARLSNLVTLVINDLTDDGREWDGYFGTVYLSTDGAKVLARQLPKHLPKLNTLELVGTKIGDLGAMAIASACRKTIIRINDITI